jgi:hypothetical protein
MIAVSQLTETNFEPPVCCGEFRDPLTFMCFDKAYESCRETSRKIVSMTGAPETSYVIHSDGDSMGV